MCILSLWKACNVFACMPCDAHACCIMDAATSLRTDHYSKPSTLRPGSGQPRASTRPSGSMVGISQFWPLKQSRVSVLVTQQTQQAAILLLETRTKSARRSRHTSGVVRRKVSDSGLTSIRLLLIYHFALMQASVAWSGCPRWRDSILTATMSVSAFLPFKSKLPIQCSIIHKSLSLSLPLSTAVFHLDVI